MSSDDDAHIPVIRGVAGPAQARRSRNWRRLGIVLFLVVIVLACLGWLGPRDATARGATPDGSEVTVTYPLLTRSGADAALEISIEDVTGPVTVQLPRDVLETLGLEVVTPRPAAETGDKTAVRLTFARPPAGELTVYLHGRMPTRSTLGPVRYAVQVGTGGEPPAEVASVRTVVLP
ncbi:hypothetical protein [Aeromicrobium sp. HA]|uniref:hypothetical protein n=1 Tax=Aeromicrobium sp. HA TaxID=3009077 RepID=UPI0022B067F2|nr:hypothetical protein [Aeromicrobium sp. HA]